MFERLRERNARRPGLELHRRSDHREQADGRAPHVGAHAQGRVPALQGAARLPPALPERLRLPGALGRGRRRARARAELEAGDRGVRARRVLAALPRQGRVVGRGDHRAVQAARHVDGLGKRLLHVLGHEHRVHLALSRDRPRARLALPGAPLDGVVPALRDVDLAARAGRLLLRQGRSLAVRPLPARGAGRGGARRLDDDAVDAARERRGRRAPGRRLRAAPGRRLGRAPPVYPDAEPVRVVKGSELVGLALHGAVRRAAGGGRGRAPRDRVGRGLARGGQRDRPHRARLRRRGLRAVEGPRAADSRPGRRGGPLLRELRVARRALDRGGGGPDRRRPARARAARRAPARSSIATRSAGAARRR